MLLRLVQSAAGGATAMTTGRLGQHSVPPNAAYAGQVVHFPDPVRAARHPRGVRVDERGFPDFSPYARAAVEIAEPPEGFGVDELRLTDYVSANAACAAAGHGLWDTVSCVATPHGWTWHHVVGSRRLELVPVEVKALLRHHGGVATAAVDQGKRGTRPLQETRPAHFRLPKSGVAVSEQQVLGGWRRIWGIGCRGGVSVVLEGGWWVCAGGCGVGSGARVAGGSAVLHGAG
ncbi:hypothetical protein GCM10020256_45850 [Streptomyces thermocoprophilus]